MHPHFDAPPAQTTKPVPAGEAAQLRQPRRQQQKKVCEAQQRQTACRAPQPPSSGRLMRRWVLLAAGWLREMAEQRHTIAWQLCCS